MKCTSLHIDPIEELSIHLYQGASSEWYPNEFNCHWRVGYSMEEKIYTEMLCYLSENNITPIWTPEPSKIAFLRRVKAIINRGTRK